MPADGNPRDTIPAPPPVRTHRGQQNERGTLVPDEDGTLPWPLVRVSGLHHTLDFMSRASMRHRAKPCMGECTAWDRCSRHEATSDVAECALQIADILEAFLARTNAPPYTPLAESLIGDALEEAKRRVLHVRPRSAP